MHGANRNFDFTCDILVKSVEIVSPANSMKNRNLILASCLLSVLVAFPSWVNAQVDAQSWVVDHSDRLSESDLRSIDDLCESINRDHHFEIFVELVESTNGVDSKKFALDLFQEKGVGDRFLDGGILIMVSVQDRRIEILLGDQIDSNRNVDRVQKIIDQDVIPEFRKGRLGRGVAKAVKRCAIKIFEINDINLNVLDAEPPIKETSSGGSVLAENPQLPTTGWENAHTRPSGLTTSLAPGDRTESGTSNHDPLTSSGSTKTDSSFSTPGTPESEVRKRQRNSIWLMFLITGGTLGIGGMTLIGGRWFLRNRMRACPKCQSEMVKLDENQEDEFLEPPERLEDELGSVRYDVWGCMNCADVIKVRYGVLFSRYSSCPQCQRKTKVEISQTVVNATQYSEGVVEVTESCANCSYHYQYSYRTPRLVPDDSSKRRRRGSRHRSGSRSTSRGRTSSRIGRRGSGGRTSGRGGSGSW